MIKALGTYIKLASIGLLVTCCGQESRDFMVFATGLIGFESTSNSDAQYLNAQSDSCNQTQLGDVHDFQIHELLGKAHPYLQSYSISKRGYQFDAVGIPLHYFNGKPNYHPVYLAQYGLREVDVFKTTGDSASLIMAIRIADKLVNGAVTIDSMLLFPYTFDFRLHGFGDQTLYAPWFSSMAQGQSLSLLSFLYSVTRDARYLNSAEWVYNSLQARKTDYKHTWMSCIDINGNVWLEEYPMDIPCFTLNGMIFAIFGLYDYYMVTKNEEANKLLKASLTTMKNNLHRFRNENDLSYYCVKHKVKDRGYHKVHIMQLEVLANMTGDDFFAEMKEAFENDTPLEKTSE